MLPKISLLLSGLTLLFFIGGMLLANKEMIPPSLGMAMYALGGLLGLCSAIFAVLLIAKTNAYPTAMLGFAGLLPFLALIAPALQSASYPLINDISTDLQNPPAFSHALGLPENQGRDMAFPSANAPLIQESYPKLKALQSTKTKEQAFQMALSVARQTLHWKITHSDEASGIIEGIATTRLFRWRDDFVIRVGATEDGGSIIDMRSKSREGKGDLGANAKRIQGYFDELVKNIVASS